MSDPATIRIEAIVAPVEAPALQAAGEQLSTYLGSAVRQVWPIQLHLRSSIEAIEGGAPGTVVVISPLTDAGRLDEPWAAVEARWRARTDALVALGPPFVICTIFRVVPNRARLTPRGAPSPLIERIGRLNRLAVELSRETACYVADVDRALAHVGAHPLQADYRLGSRQAVEVAGHALAWTLMSGPLDDAVPPEIQEKAKAIHGGVGHIETMLQRRLTQG